MNNPKVSIIIPLYNGNKYIKQAIQSCCRQTHKDIEIIVIDDDSADNGVNLVKEIQKLDNRVSSYQNEKNLGLIKTVNKGIKLSSGQYILVFGQDDILTENHIETMLKEFDDSAGIVYCNSILIDGEGKQISEVKTVEDEIIVDLFKLSFGNVVNSCGLIMRKSIIEKVGFYDENERYPNYGEWSLWIKIANISNIKYCYNTYSYYRRHTTNITNTFNEIQTLKKLNPYFDYCKKLAYSLGNFSLRQKIIFWIYYTRYKIRYKLKMLKLKISEKQ